MQELHRSAFACKAANIDVGINNSRERSLEPTCYSSTQAQPHGTQRSHGTPFPCTESPKTPWQQPVSQG